MLVLWNSIADCTTRYRLQENTCQQEAPTPVDCDNQSLYKLGTPITVLVFLYKNIILKYRKVFVLLKEM